MALRLGGWSGVDSISVTPVIGKALGKPPMNSAPNVTLILLPHQETEEENKK